MAKKENIGLWNKFMLHFNSDNIQSILYFTFVANIPVLDNNNDIVLTLRGKWIPKDRFLTWDTLTFPKNVFKSGLKQAIAHFISISMVTWQVLQ